MENPVKMDDLGVPLFSETSIWYINYIYPWFFLARFCEDVKWWGEVFHQQYWGRDKSGKQGGTVSQCVAKISNVHILVITYRWGLGKSKKIKRQSWEDMDWINTSELRITTSNKRKIILKKWYNICIYTIWYIKYESFSYKHTCTLYSLLQFSIQKPWHLTALWNPVGKGVASCGTAALLTECLGAELGRSTELGGCY